MGCRFLVSVYVARFLAVLLAAIQATFLQLLDWLLVLAATA